MTTNANGSPANSQPTVGGRCDIAVDIIVPVYKNPELTARCLESLVAHLDEISSCDPRVIVINDSPADPDVRKTLALVASNRPVIRVLENEHNLGFVGSVNRGLTLACGAGRDVILVNSDTQTYPGTLRNLLNTAYADSQIGFVSPRSNNASLCSLPHLSSGNGTVSTPEAAYSRWLLLSRTMPNFHFTPTAVGFYLYIKHSVLANFGLLDPQFGLGYEEENDLILRANKAGYRAALANKAFAFHAGSASFGLIDVDLESYKSANMERTAARHPEYLPLIRRYEESAHFRAEELLSKGLRYPPDRPTLLFDLSALGPAFDGTSEMSVAIVEAFCERHASTFDFNVLCTEEVFKFHGLDRHSALRRHDPALGTSERFTLGVRLAQPFNAHALRALDDLAAVNVYGMLDTIADDCGYLSITHQLKEVWGHVACHANGLFFISRFSEQAFVTRYPDAQQSARYVNLLPTRLSSYAADTHAPASEHVLIMGNHFAHKAADSTAEILKEAFPAASFVVLGKENRVSGNLRAYQSGALDKEQMKALYARASVVVLPSHVEGFGFGLVRALAAGKPVVARDIPVTREILTTYKSVRGVHLYANDRQVVGAFRLALNERASRVEDDGAAAWGDWVDGFATFCQTLLTQDDIFQRIVRRMQACDLLGRAALSIPQPTSAAGPVKANADIRVGAKRPVTDLHGRQWLPVHRLQELLRLEGEEFVYSAYVTILNRLPDPGGLVNYLGELQSGIGKLEIVVRLRNSPEGRKASSPLRGYRSALLRKRLLQF